MPAFKSVQTLTRIDRRILLLLIDISLAILAVLVINQQSDGRTHLAQAQGQTDFPTTPTPGTAPKTQEPPGQPPPENESRTSNLPKTALPPTQVLPSAPTAISSWNVPSASPGTLFLALDESGHSHLFAYHPQNLPLTRLTTGSWDDITPAASPDGRQLAFASNRDGWWDLYLLDLESGKATRLTASPEYDAAPTWSPDGRWLAYETYTGEGGGLEIFLRQVPDGSDTQPEPVRLTEDHAADSSPAWSPNGRLIAFISDRTGEAEVWLADLDQVENRFRNLSHSTGSQESHPAWSPDGTSLAWSSSQAGFRTIQGREFAESSQPLRSPGSGEWPAWSPDGALLATSLAAPNQVYLTGYLAGQAGTPGLSLPPVPLGSAVFGLSWGSGVFSQPFPTWITQVAGLSQEPAWQPRLTAKEGIPAGRFGLVSLLDVSAPYPLLQDQVDEAFVALRQEVAQRAGWDFLANLENAFVPLTTPLFPGMAEDWLYTGRAFAFNAAPQQAGWILAVREDFGAETYWHIWVRSRFQDGSQGVPLHDLPWNFDARSSGKPRAYEQGGDLAPSVSPGYWVDFTALASGLGWQRLPALSSWRSAYGAARYNEFVLADGLGWEEAMLEIYPAEVLIHPVALAPATDQVPASTPAMVVEATQNLPPENTAGYDSPSPFNYP